jgi:hypothetical protein
MKSSASSVLSPSGCLVSIDEVITQQRSWDSSSSNSASSKVNIVVNLNEYIVFSLTDQYNISLKFTNGNISYNCDMGIKKKRWDSYLDHAKREIGGKLIPQIIYKSLKQRQKDFNESVAAQRNKVYLSSNFTLF